MAAAVQPVLSEPTRPALCDRPLWMEWTEGTHVLDRYRGLPSKAAQPPKLTSLPKVETFGINGENGE